MKNFFVFFSDSGRTQHDDELDHDHDEELEEEQDDELEDEQDDELEEQLPPRPRSM